MADNRPDIGGIVRPAPKESMTGAGKTLLGKRIPIQRLQQWAPAWFYSALNWLGKTYYDANNSAQSFNTYMAGSDVHRYGEIGWTRLFLILSAGGSFRLSIAP